MLKMWSDSEGSAYRHPTTPASVDTDFDTKEMFPTSSLSRIALSAGTACVDSCRLILPLNVTAGWEA